MTAVQSQSTSFQLPPLPPSSLTGPKHIRVLKVAPPLNPDDQIIRGELQVIELNESAAYSALSYVWGTSPASKTIFYGTHEIPVTPNCWSALWHLRNGYYSNDDRYSGGSKDTMTIWIDSICINQKDTKEKESQISFMADIYSFSQRTYVWIGDGTLVSDAAMDHLETAGFQDILQEEDDFCYDIPQRTTKLALMLFIRCCLTSFSMLWHQGPRKAIDYYRNHRRQPAILEDLFCRTWATRIWTFQEILLSPNPLVCCGTKALPWRNLVHASVFFEKTCFLGDPTTFQNPDARWFGVVTLWVFLHKARVSRDYMEKYYKFAIDISYKHSWFSQCFYGIITILYCLPWVGVFTWKLRNPSKARMRILIIVVVCTIVGYLVFASVAYSVHKYPGVIRQLIRRKKHPHLATKLVEFERREATLAKDLNVPEAITCQIIVRQASNPKDKSFGISSVLGRTGPKLQDPDYSRSLQAIHKELFIRLIDWSGSLNLLLLVDSVRDLENQLSWVPNWTVPLDSTWLDLETLIGFGHGIIDFRDSSTCQVRGGNELIIRGHIASRVIWRCGQFHETSLVYVESERSQHYHNLTMIFDFMHQYDARNPARQGWSTYWKSTVFESLYFVLLNKKRDEYWTQLSMLKRWEKILTRASKLSNPLGAALRLLRSQPKVLTFHIAVCNDFFVKKRTLFYTEPDMYGMGNGPSNIAVNDVLALVDGVSMPLVLRDRSPEPGFRLLGFSEQADIQRHDYNLNVVDGTFGVEDVRSCVCGRFRLWLYTPRGTGDRYSISPTKQRCVVIKKGLQRRRKDDSLNHGSNDMKC